MDLTYIQSEEIRKMIRNKQFNKFTSGVAIDYTQCNLVILKKRLAYDFLLFCQRNPKPCPIIDVTEIGSSKPTLSAIDADIRTDLPGYRIYKYGELTEKTDDISDYWEDDMVAFLLGCSNTFEKSLINNNIPIRNIEMGTMAPAYKSNIPTVKAGVFEGPMVVGMRPIPKKDIVRTIQITSRFPSTHGSPIHIGSPDEIGIKDINKPDYGDPVHIKDGEIPVFWGCGITPQAVANNTKPPIMITHEPGKMFITDILDESLSIL